MHVVIDGYGGDPDQLADESAVRAILEQYPEAMGMTKIAPPTVVRYQGDKREDWGLSGFVMIAESHVSIHTFPARGLVWMDVFSCKGFDESPILDDLRTRFRLTDMRVGRLERGLEFAVPAGAIDMRAR